MTKNSFDFEKMEINREWRQFFLADLFDKEDKLSSLFAIIDLELVGRRL